jgi:hypothetical protein
MMYSSGVYFDGGRVIAEFSIAVKLGGRCGILGQQEGCSFLKKRTKKLLLLQPVLVPTV